MRCRKLLVAITVFILLIASISPLLLPHAGAQPVEKPVVVELWNHADVSSTPYLVDSEHNRVVPFMHGWISPAMYRYPYLLRAELVPAWYGPYDYVYNMGGNTVFGPLYQDTSIAIYNVETGETIQIPGLNNNTIGFIGLSPDRNRVLFYVIKYVTDTVTVAEADIATGQILFHDNIAFSPSDISFTYAEETYRYAAIYMWNSSLTCVAVYGRNENGWHRLFTKILDPGPGEVATTSIGLIFVHENYNYILIVYDSNGSVVARLDSVYSFTISPDEKAMYVSFENGTICEYYIEWGKIRLARTVCTTPYALYFAINYAVDTCKSLLVGYSNGQVYIISLQTGAYTTVPVGGGTSIVTIDPSGRYIAGAKVLWMVVAKDPQSGKPRIRFWGKAVLGGSGWYDLGKPITMAVPSGTDWHAYFFGGKIVVKKLYASARPVELVSDTDIREAKLWKLYREGRVGIGTAAESGASVKLMAVNEGDTDHDIWWQVHFESHGNAMASASMLVYCPFATPLLAEENATVVVRMPAYMRVISLWGVKEGQQQEVDAGTAVLAGAGGIATAGGLFLLGESLAGEVGAGAAATGIGAIVVGVVLLGYAAYKTAYGTIYIRLVAGPCAVVEYQGRRYLLASVYLPSDEYVSHLDEWKKMVQMSLQAEAVKKVVAVDSVAVDFRTSSAVKTWKDYTRAIQTGFFANIRLHDIVASTLDIDPSRARVLGFGWLLSTLITASAGWLNYFQGMGAEYKVFVRGQLMSCRGIMHERIIANPSEIAATLHDVTVNGVSYSVKVTNEGATVQFSVPDGATSLAIDFGALGYFGELDGYVTVLVKKDFSPLDDVGYTVSLHYDWKGVMIRLERIEFVDMPYPPILIERIFHYREGVFRHEIPVRYLHLNASFDDPTSPSGKRYDYILSSEDAVQFFDPANGGMLEPCKTFTINYFYRQPPDVSLKLYLNGTSITSTLAKHATVVLKSNVEQSVGFTVTFAVKTLVGFEERTIASDTIQDTLQVKANWTVYRVYNISQYVARAIEFMKNNGSPAFVEITANITSAESDYIKSNDFARIVYYPPPLIWQKYGEPANLTVRVYNALSGAAIGGAVVVAQNETATIQSTTNSSGVAVLSVVAGLWNLKVTASDFKPYTTQIYVHSNMTFNVPLVPENASVPPPTKPPVNGSEVNYPAVVYNNKSYWWLSVQTVWNDGMPFEGAVVTVWNLSSGTVLFQTKTAGDGFVHFLIPNATEVRVEVNATNPDNASETYHAVRDFNMTQHFYLVFRLPWISKEYSPEVMLVYANLAVHRGQGYFMGNVSHLVYVIVWTNKPQTVTIRASLVDVTTNATLATTTKTVALKVGSNEVMLWVSLNITKEVSARAKVEIVSYEYDTDITNNVLWTNAETFKPYLDIAVFIIWRVVKTKVEYALLPGDTIEIDVGARVNTAVRGMELSYSFMAYNVSKGRWVALQEKLENITLARGGYVWRNVTLSVPWVPLLNISVVALHPWEDVAMNNVANATIRVDPDVAIVKVEMPRIVVSGELVHIRVYMKHNIMISRPSMIYAYDEENNTLARISFTMPTTTVEGEITTPENRWIIPGFLRAPSQLHSVDIVVVSYDMYPNDDVKRVKITCTSLGVATFALVIVAIMVLLTIVVIASKVLRHTHVYIEQYYRFVKRRKRTSLSSLRHYVILREERKNGEKQYKFVKKRKNM